MRTKRRKCRSLAAKPEEDGSEGFKEDISEGFNDNGSDDPEENLSDCALPRRSEKARGSGQSAGIEGRHAIASGKSPKL